MSDLFIPIILGTGREGRHSEKVATYVLSRAQQSNLFQTQLVDVRDFASPVTFRLSDGNQVIKPFQEIVKKSHGLIIVTPEYNHGIPGELKILIDSLYVEYKDKPVGICATSDGSWAGTRAVEHLYQVLIGVEAHPLKKTLLFPNVDKTFDDQGNLNDPTQDERTQKFLEMISTYAQKFTLI